MKFRDSAELLVPSTWRILWSLPNTLLGLAFAAASLALPRPARGVLIAVAPKGLARLFLTRRGFYAITLGRVVVSTGPLTEELLAHELEHVRQFERWGPFFIPLYLLEHARRGYLENRFEAAAVGAARAFVERQESKVESHESKAQSG